MIYYQTGNSARFTAILNNSEDLSALDALFAVNYATPINGITIYRDEECTDIMWSNNKTFIIDNLAENYSEASNSLSKYIDLVPAINQ